MVEMNLQPLHFAFKELVNGGMLRYTMKQKIPKWGDSLAPELQDQFAKKLNNLLVELQRYKKIDCDIDKIVNGSLVQLTAVLQIPAIKQTLTGPDQKLMNKQFNKIMDKNQLVLPILISAIVLDAMCKFRIHDENQSEDDLVSELKLSGHLESALREFSQIDSEINRAIEMLDILIKMQGFTLENSRLSPNEMVDFIKNQNVQKFIQVNKHDRVLWFNKESFEEFLEWLFIIKLVALTSKAKMSLSEIHECMNANFAAIDHLLIIAKESEYQLEKMLAGLGD